MSDITVGTVVKLHPFTQYEREEYYHDKRPFEGERAITRISNQIIKHPYLVGMHGYHRDELLVKGVDYT